ncbi:hypothetical protein OO012_13380 [Rhodobacteraceae bacterium KMM 6894]|nr:hypothetical protein [Rhodobacteraceae bacterium KMM 6894]
MSAPIKISNTEAGIVRLFTVDLPPEDIAKFTTRNGRWPLAEALDADALDPNYIDVFDVSDLQGLGLTTYLADGHGIPEDQLAAMRPRLEGLHGTIMVVTSRAFSGQAQTITPRAPLDLIASFTEDRAPVSFDPLPDASAKDTPSPASDSTRKPVSDAAMSGRIATVVLLMLFALVVVMVWIAA